MRKLRHPYYYTRLSFKIVLSKLLDQLTTTYYKTIFKRFNVEYGRNLRIRYGAQLDLFDGCEIKISDNNTLQGYFRVFGKLYVGKNNLFKKHNNITINKGAEMMIGDNNLLGGVECNVLGKIRIGDYNLFSEDILVYDNNSHSIDHEERKRSLSFLPDSVGQESVKIGRIIIGDHNFIGRRVVFLKNTNMGDRCVLGVGAVVNNNIPDDSLVFNPTATAKPVGSAS